MLYDFRRDDGRRKKSRIDELVDGKQLKALHKLAEKSESIESFEKDAQAILASTEKV